VGPPVFKTGGAAPGVARWVRLPCAPAKSRSRFARRIAQPARLAPRQWCMSPSSAIALTASSVPRTELVRRAADGDADAFELLVEPQIDRSFRTARAMLGNDADARDATQDAYVAAWRELPTLRDPSSFDAWLQRIVVNACRSVLRRRGRVREVSLEATPGAPEPSRAAEADAVGDAESLARAYDRLDPDKRAILVLHYLEHEPVDAIAAAIGLRPGTVKWRLSEARAALGRALVAEGGR
jgi:RNA polymerase sigma-70 factor, ECF subfamily